MDELNKLKEKIRNLQDMYFEECWEGDTQIAIKILDDIEFLKKRLKEIEKNG